MGCPVTVLTDSAAPPRESPSVFVRMTPVNGNDDVEIGARCIDQQLCEFATRVHGDACWHDSKEPEPGHGLGVAGKAERGKRREQSRLLLLLIPVPPETDITGKPDHALAGREQATKRRIRVTPKALWVALFQAWVNGQETLRTSAHQKQPRDF